MKKIKRLSKAFTIMLLFLISSIGMAYSQTPTLKNNPVKTDPNMWGEVYLTGTTFSIQNDDSQTDKNYFLMSDIVFGRPLASFEMGSKFQEANAVWNNGGTVSVPRFTIMSNPALLESSYTEKTDDVNRLIFRAPKVNETVFKVYVTGYKPYSKFSFNFNIEEIAGGESSVYTVYVNGEKITNSEFSINSQSSINVAAYSERISTSQILIELKRTSNSGDNTVYAISDLYVYGERDALSVAATPMEGSLGEPVTLSAIVQDDIETTSVQWMKKIGNETTWIVLPSTELTITDLPMFGETYYKAVLPTGEESVVVTVTRDVSCGESTSKYLFVEDFGKLASDQKRASSSYVKADVYTYRPECTPLKEEGTYAVVANPKYGGNGDMDNNGNSCNIDGVLWFCDRYDHTQGGLKNGVYGGMLMVNCSENQGTLIYSREVAIECKNVIMNFTAWFANASNQANQAPIKAQFRVKDGNGNYIKEAEIDVPDIAVGEPWKKGISTFYSGENNKFTVEIWNLSAGGTGNDMLIDDISFSICSPKITLTYKTEAEAKRENNFITGTCEEDIEITAQGEYVNSIFANPYYLWVIKEPTATEYKISTELSAYKNDNTSVNVVKTQFQKQAAEYFVIVAGSKEDAEEYYEKLNSGENIDLACSAISMSDTIAVACTPTYVEIIEESRNCNLVTITSKTNSKDLLGWIVNGEILKDDSGNKVLENTLEIEITEEVASMTIKAISSDMAESNVITIYPITISNKVIDSKGNELILTSVPSVNYGEQIIITTNITPVSDVSKYPIIYKNCEGSVLQSKVGVTGYNPVVNTPICVYTEFRGCKSDEINVNVKTFVEIKELNRNCNTISFTCTTNLKSETLKWYYSKDGVEYMEYSSGGATIEMELTEEFVDGVYIKAVAEDNTSSNIITVYPVLMSNKVYNASIQEISVDAGAIEVIEGENEVLIKTSIKGWTMLNTDLITYKSCDGGVLASNVEGEFITSITEQNKCFITEFRGCISDNIEFKIRPKEIIWPTAFNPLNQDGINDTFVTGYGIKVMIMDRYGNVVAESEDGWDGTIRGGNAMPGVYFYVATLPDGTIKKGTIELVHYVK